MSQFNLNFKNNIISIRKNKSGGNIIRNNPQPLFKVNQIALNGYFKQVELNPPSRFNILSMESFLKNNKPLALQSLEKNPHHKVIMCATAKMTDGEKTRTFYFKSKPHVLYPWNNKNKVFNDMFQEVLNEFYKKSFEGSGWAFKNFLNVSLDYGKYTPFRGGCGMNKLPEWITVKRAVICMIAGEGDRCFYWCILRHFNPREKDKGRITKDLLKIFKEEPNKYADFTGVNFPTSAEDLQHFQNHNPHIHLIIYGVDNINKRTPVIFDGETRGEMISLLYYENHFYLIPDLSRLLSSQLTNSNGRVYFCYKCQRSYKDPEKLEKHAERCNDLTLLELPEEGSDKEYIEFKPKTDKPPNITVYFDFESFLIPCTNEEGIKQNKHEPSAWAFYIVSTNEQIYKSKPFSYGIKRKGEDVAGLFVKTLISEIVKANSVFFNEGKASNLTPVLCHNLSGYDSHLFIIKLAEYMGRLSVLPSTNEKYISFSKYCYVNNKLHEIRFLDSFKFLSSSLSQLVDETKANKFYHTSLNFPGIPLEMLTRKGVYPYEFMTDFEKTKLPILPPVQNFYSKLQKQGITSEDYKHALKAWEVFKCKNIGDYMLKYCELDVLLLSDVMENFRKMNKEAYGLDPVFYGYTTPGASWVNMLKYTKQKIRLITNRDIYEDFEKGIRGGVSMCVTRYAKANNKYLSDYDPSKPSNYIFYIDKNNLYGEAMSEKMPYEIERRLKKNEFKKWRSFNCALVCDLEIPKDKKEYLKDYPPAPEHLKINGVIKLVPNLRNKKEYLVYGELLKYYEKLGVKVTKIHRGYVFKVSKWLAPYIANNSEKRANTEDTTKQNFYKLCNNSIYGKTIENPRKRSNVEIINTEKRAQKLLMSPEYTDFKVFSPDLVAVTKKKTLVYCNKPIFIGFCVLELSKLKMYELFYNYIKPKFGDRVQLLYTDTDSFILDIQSDDIYEEMKEDLNTRFDTWKYPKNHFLHSMDNKNRLGFFKDETKGKPIKDYAATCSKSYAYREEREKGELEETTKIKGVVEACLKTGDICFNDYIKCIFDNEEKYVNYSGFKSESHQIYTEDLKKIALNPNQDVRHVLEDGVNTLPIGYYSEEED